MKLIASAAVVLFMSIFMAYVSDVSPFEQQHTLGEITIIVIDEFGDVVIDETLSFNDEDTLLSLLDEHYTIVYTSTAFSMGTGRILLEIGPVSTDFEKDFIEIRITGYLPKSNGNRVIMHDDLSPVGIDLIPLVDGNTYQFRYKKIGS